MLGFAIDTAQRAGRLLLRYRRRGLRQDQIHIKVSHADLVTEADIASDQLIARAIHSSFPDHVILSEEGSKGIPPAVEWLWVVDPLDGTTNFAHGLPLFAVNLALANHGRVVLAVTHDPTANRTYWAEAGSGAWVRARGQDQRLRVSETAILSQCLLATHFPYDRGTNPDDNLAEFVALERRSRAVRRLGSSALAQAWVAAGMLDGYWEAGLKPWDTAPGALLVTEAGGIASDYWGQPWHLRSRNMLVTNGRPEVHLSIRDVIALTRKSLGASPSSNS
jgi:myo-inositol-1(or 4)-monophosphatase